MTQLTFVPASYDEAEEFLDGRDSRRIGSNTWIESYHGAYALRLHDTRVVLYNDDGSLTLRSGGWQTSTTKDRLSQVLRRRDLTIFQERGQWYVAKAGDWNRDHWLPFAESMRVEADNTVLFAGILDDVRERHALVKRINKYAQACANALGANELPYPGPGDCIYCAMRTIGGNVPLGEASGDRDHLISHLDEMYLVPSLVMRAMELYSTPFLVQLTLQAMREDGDISNWITVVEDSVKRTAAKYLKLQLGVAR